MTTVNKTCQVRIVSPKHPGFSTITCGDEAVTMAYDGLFLVPMCADHAVKAKRGVIYWTQLQPAIVGWGFTIREN